MTAQNAAVSVAAWPAMMAAQPRWRGVPCQQFPSDLWRYAELVFRLRPPFVLETGTAAGGTALFLADVLEAAGGGEVITVDVEPPSVTHERLICVQRDSADPGTASFIRGRFGGARGLVLLDGDHSSGQVLRELDTYADLADYLVAEDTIMEHLPQYGDGPHVALAKWLPDHPEFAPDPDPSPTQHPGGWLRRVR